MKDNDILDKSEEGNDWVLKGLRKGLAPWRWAYMCKTLKNEIDAERRSKSKRQNVNVTVEINANELNGFNLLAAVIIRILFVTF